MEQITTARSIETITAEIIIYKQQAGAAILAIGQRLIEAKEQLPHGEWLPWLEQKVEFSETTAQRFMRLAREYEDPALVADLGAAKALALLAVPADEREAFLQEHYMVNGEEKTALEMSRRELEEAIRQRDEARAGAVDAESRAKLYEERFLDQQKRAELMKASAEREKEQFLAELEELRNAPQQVAIEKVLDEEAVKAAADAARKETEAALRAKIEKAQHAAERAEKAKVKAEQSMAALKVAQESDKAAAEKERQNFAEEVKALQKKLEMAASSEVAIFKLHFEQAQREINAMKENIDRMKENGDLAGAEKLRGALGAMLQTAMDMLV